MPTNKITQVAALIVAAGHSTRMGYPKALLPIEGTTFLQRIHDSFQKSGVCKIWATHPNLPKINATTLTQFDIPALENKWPHRAMLGSVQSILSTIGNDIQALLICPVDSPFVSPQLVDSFLDAFRENNNQPIIIATHKGQLGHPILFDRYFFKKILNLGDRGSLRDIIESASDKIIKLECQDPRILCNINTKEDYARFVNPSLNIGDAAATEAPGSKFS